MIHIAVCESSESVGKEIIQLLHIRYQNRIKTSYFKTSFELDDSLECLKDDGFHILIINVSLSDSNGIETAQYMKVKQPNMLIIFISEDTLCACDIFEANPFYFLLIPVSSRKLFRSIDKAMEMIEKNNPKQIKITFRNETTILDLNRILYIESNNRKIRIYMEETQYEIYKKMDELLDELPKNFLRCHQSYAVNMDMIRCLTADSIELQNQITVPISRGRKKDVYDTFLKYTGEI